MRHVKKTIAVEVQYFVGRQDLQEGVFEGGVPEPEFLGELTADVSTDEVWDEARGSLVPTGKTQINLRGSRRAYAALARYLLALTELETLDPDYHDHFGEIRDSSGKLAVHLIVHAPKA